MKAMGFVSCVVACLAALALPASGDDKYWMPATGDWADPANWDPAGVPTSADDAYIDNGGTATVASSAAAYYVYLGDENTGTVIQTGGTHDIAERFYMAWEGDSAGVYGLQGGELSVGTTESVGLYGTGIFTHTAGTHVVGGELNIGHGVGATGHYSLSGAGRLEADEEYIGTNGTGSFIQSGGTNAVFDCYVGGFARATGTYELSAGIHSIGNNLSLGFSSAMPTGSYNMQDGILTVGGNAKVGERGTGSFTQTGGTHSVGHVLYVGRRPGSTGVYDLQDGELTVGGWESIGFEGTGSFTQTGGTHTVHEDLSVGTGQSTPASTGFYHLQGGELTVGDWESISMGSFTQTGGTHNVLQLWVARNVGTTGIYELHGGQFTSSISIVGLLGTGTFTQTAGIHRTMTLMVGHYWPEMASCYTLENGQLTVEFSEDIGAGRFVQTGGVHSAGDLTLGYGGIYDLQDGELTVGDRELIGCKRTGTFTQTGGTHCVSNSVILSEEADSSGVYNLQGGVLSASTIKGGEGTWAFNFTGGTLHAGTVEFDLANDGGVLAPGQSVGATAISGGYDQNAGELQIELAGPAEFDTLDVSGSAALGGSLNVLGFEGYRPNEGDSFPIITAGGGFVGDFSEIVSNITTGIPDGLEAFAGSIDGTAYEITFNGLSTGDANGDHRASLGDLCIMAGNWNQSGKSWADADFNGDGTVSIGDLCMLAGNWGWQLPAGAAVPEPTTLSLLALGALAVVRRRWRQA